MIVQVQFNLSAHRWRRTRRYTSPIKRWESCRTQNPINWECYLLQIKCSVKWCCFIDDWWLTGVVEWSLTDFSYSLAEATTLEPEMLLTIKLLWQSEIVQCTGGCGFRLECLLCYWPLMVTDSKVLCEDGLEVEDSKKGLSDDVLKRQTDETERFRASRHTWNCVVRKLRSGRILELIK